uniref:Ovule protein n=1 Tax=Parascaris univalens TaxID=6257 RepID=A0A914ZHT5_PARUN
WKYASTKSVMNFFRFSFIIRIDVSSDACIINKLASSKVSSYSSPVYVKLEYFNTKQLLACKYLHN